MKKTLKYLLEQHDNDYSHLETEYRQRTGSELVTDPYASIRQTLPDLDLTASVIIPAYNASHTILQCLYAIEQSSFNRKYPGQLEVIVVDDGSDDGTWELLNQLSFALSLKIVRQANHGRSQARNTALAVATGDVVICCDADLLMTPFTIEEFMKRHQILDHVLLLGFYTYLHESDPQAHQALLPCNYGRVPTPFQLDRRVKARPGVWPDSICCDTLHLKRLGSGRVLYKPYDIPIDLPEMVFGPLFSLRRRDFLLMGGFEERIQGWGGEITLAGARAIALGNFIIPVYSAGGFHIYQHLDDLHFLWRYNPEQRQTWQEFATNFQFYQQLLNAPFIPASASWINHARARIQHLCACSPAAHRKPVVDDEMFHDTYKQELRHAGNRARYLLSLGRYHEALETLATIQTQENEQEMVTLVCRQAEALLYIGKPQEAVSRLQQALKALPPHEDLSITLALALAADHQFVAAQQYVYEAQRINPAQRVLRYIMDRSCSQHRGRARLFLSQGDYELALRDYEAALICDPDHFPTYVQRAQILCALGRHEAARTARTGYYLSTHPVIAAAPDKVSMLSAAWEELAANRPGTAKLALEQLGHLCGPTVSIARHLQEIHEYAELCNWQYSHQSLLALARDIPGPFTENELGLILTVALQVLITQDTDRQITMVELGCFCGQATVVLGLAIQSTGIPAHVIALYEVPTEIIDIDHAFTGHSFFAVPPEVFYWQLHKYKITDLVTLTTTLHADNYDSSLLLISQQGKEENVRQKVGVSLSRLRAGGLLLVHQHTDDHQFVQDMLHELLMSEDYQLLTQVDNLTVLQRKLENTCSRAEGR